MLTVFQLFEYLTAFSPLSVKLATVWSPIKSLCCLELMNLITEKLIVEPFNTDLPVISEIVKGWYFCTSQLH